MYGNSPNNSTTSLSDNDDDEVIKDESLTVYPYYQRELVPAQWTSPTSARGFRPQTPPNSPTSHLPPEILIHILRQIHSSRDLYSSLLVSKAWCECAVELLWHRPTFNDLSRFVQMLQVIGSDDKLFDYSRFIRRLNFVYLSRDLTDTLFVRLAKCTKLERLTLVNCVELSDEALLRVLPQCMNLVAVDLTNITSCTDRAITALAQSATKLQGLNLGGCKNVTDEGVLAVARHCPLLRRIKLSNVKNITDTAVSALAKQCSLLLEIDLHGCIKVTDEAVRDLWAHLTHLRDFRLAHCADLTDLAFPAPPQARPGAEPQLTVQPFPNSAPIPNDVLPPLRLNRLCEHLRMLDLTACALITDEAVAGIVAVAPKIRNLYLAKCSQLTDAAVESICKLGKHLHYLHLGHASSITDRSVRTLARSCTRLRYIDLACCPLLTDMSVFELSTLPKLRRIGLVRVTNLTDQAVFSLADRHNTLERIHLSYCEHITVLAIHFLLQRLTKLTHLSLTGIPAFRRAELQQFCRAPPREFNTNQRAAFCVYSGKGVENLRLYLAELMAHVQAEVNAGGEHDSDYDPEEDEEFPSSNSDQERMNRRAIMHDSGISDMTSVETPRIPYASTREQLQQEREWRENGIGILSEEIFEDNIYGSINGYGMAISLLPSTVTTVRGRPARTISDRSHSQTDSGPLIVEDNNPSSVATTPSPTVQPYSGTTPTPSSSSNSRGQHVFGQDLIVEAPTPSPQITPYPSRQNGHSHSVPTFHRANSNTSDGASNRSARSSGTNKTSTSNGNGAGFFRNYIANGPYSSSDAALGSYSRAGVYTPDLEYAEIGHGKGSNLNTNGSMNGAGPGPSTMQQLHQQQQQQQGSSGCRYESSSSSLDLSRMAKNGFRRLNGSDTVLHGGERGPERAGVLVDTSNTSYHRGSSSARVAIPTSQARREHHHDPSSPIPYLSSSPTTRELQESVHNALSGTSTSRSTSHANRNSTNSAALPTSSSRAPTGGPNPSSNAGAGIIQEDAIAPSATAATSNSTNTSTNTTTRGRSMSVRRSLKNTLSVAEQYASALFFRNGNNSNSSASSPGSGSGGGTAAGGSASGIGSGSLNSGGTTVNGVNGVNIGGRSHVVQERH